MVGTTIPTIDLWQVAIDKLDSDLKTSLLGIDGDQLDVLASVLREAENKKKLCLQKRLKIRFNGKVVILRDVFDKIIAWVNEFKAIVDVAVQFDPTAASLPWAGIRFLLEVAVSDKQCFESTIHGLEVVSHMIARYTAVEVLYMHNKSIVHEELQSKLASLYVQILTFLAKSVEYFSQSTTARMLKSIFQTTQDKQLKGIAEIDREIERLERISDAEIQQQTQTDVAKVRDILQTLENPLNRLVDASMIYAKALQEKEFFEFLKWLSAVPYTQHHARHSEKRLPGSAKWLFEHPQYISWQGSSSSSVFLLHGIPGCGKTSIVSAVIDSFLNERSRNPLTMPLAYFYCADSKFGRDNADPDEIMRSLTRQLAVIDKTRQTLHEQVLLEYERRAAEARIDGFEVPKLRSKECTDLILELLGSNPAVIIVDGVDEIEESRRHELLKSLIRVRDESASIVKIFLSSRDNSNIFAHSTDAIKLRIQEVETRNDMQLFINHHISNAISNQTLLNGNVDCSLQEDLENFLLDRAGEMFLWVNLQMEKFCTLKSRTTIIEAMKDRSKASTKTINDMYTEILDHMTEIDSTASQAAIRAFSWLLCIYEPLSPRAFLEAVSITETGAIYETTLEELLATCSNLIIVDNKQDTIRFAHLSVRQYLESRPEFEITRASSVATMGCLSACIRDMPYYFDEQTCTDTVFPIYGSMYWAKHYKIASTNKFEEDKLRLKLKEFIFDDGDTSFSFIGWLETVQGVAELLPNDHSLKKELGAVMSSNMTPLFAACIYGLKEVVQSLAAEKDFDVDERNALGHTGLYLACVYGHHEIVKLLLKHHADVSIECGQHKNSICAACFGGHVEVVRLLLNQRDECGTVSFREQGLEVAILAGHENVVKLLLEDGLEISSQDNYNKLFASATELGFSEVTQYMNKKFQSFNRRDIPLSNKLVDSAISKGQLKYLMRHCEKSSLPDTAIATASFYGQTNIVSWFLDKGLDIEKEGRFGTPLRTASLMGHESTVRLLIERGADVNANSLLGDALQAASMNGHLSITALLLRSRADVNHKGGYYGTALQAAAYRGHREVVDVLLGAGAAIYGGGLFSDAFYAAVEAGREEIISLFTKRGYHFPRPFGRSMACMAAPQPYRNLLQELDMSKNNPYARRQRNVELEKPDSPKFFPVSDFEEAFRSARGISVVDKSKPSIRHSFAHQSARDGSYALETAASLGWGKVVNQIIENREKLGINTDEIGRGLLEASISGHSGIVDYLLLVPLDLRSFIMGSIQRAAWHGHITILQSLLKYQEKWGLAKNGLRSHSTTYWVKEQQPSRRDPPIDEAFSNQYVLQIVLSSCRGDQPSVLALALKLADDNERQKLSDIALSEAAMSNSINVIKSLYQGGKAFESDTSSQAFKGASKYGSTSALACLIHQDQKKILQASDFQNGLIEAISNGHNDTVQFLISESPEKYDQSLLEDLFVDAASKGYLGILKILFPEISNGDSNTMILSQSLDQACFYGHLDVAEFLIEAGADLDGLVDKVSRLSDKDKDKDKRLARIQARKGAGHCYQFPRTPLQASLQAIPDYCADEWEVRQFRKKKTDTARKQEVVIQLLLHHGADVRLVGGSERTPLHSAVLNCSRDIVLAILEHGADVNSEISKEKSPLQCAARREVDSLPIFRALLEAGAHIIVKTDEKGSTSPMLDASLSFFDEENGRFIQSDSVEEIMTDGPGGVIKLLLESKPDLKATDKRFGLLLQMAAAIGDKSYISLLIERKVNINSYGHYYGCALQAAAKFGQVECVSLLLEAGADVNLIQGTFGTPLQAAIEAGHLEVARSILQAGADVNLYFKAPETLYDGKTNARMSPLELAVQSKSSQITQFLLDAGAEINPEKPFLHLAAESGDLDMVKIFLEAGVDANKNFPHRRPPLVSACGHGNMEMVELLLAKSADVNADGIILDQYSIRTPSEGASALHIACARGHKQVAQMLLDKGADPEKSVENSLTPIGVAAEAGHIDIIDQLITAGAKIYDFSRALNVLKEALQSKNSKATIKFLLKKLSGSDDLFPACNQALAVARSKGDEESFVLLLKQLPKSLDILSQSCKLGSLYSVKLISATGVDINIDLPDGARTLHTAAYHQRLELVSYLISKGADVCYVSSQYGSPLCAALEGLMASAPSISSEISGLLPEAVLKESKPYYFGQRQTLDDEKQSACEEIMKVLIQAGATVNVEPRLLGVPIHMAAYLGILPLVKLLLEKGADINSTGGYFGSALIAAINVGSQIIVQYLLDQGIDVNILSQEFGTALHYASTKRDKRLMQVLLQHGADINATGSKQETPLSVTLATYDRHNVGKDSLEETVDLLLQYGDRLRVRAEDIKLAASIRDFYLGKDTMQRLLEIGKDLQITVEIIAAAAASDDFPGGRTLKLLLPRASGIEITPEIFKSVQNYGNLKLLLQHKPRCEISSDIFETLATNRFHGVDMVKIIIEEEPHVIPTEAVIVALMKSEFRQHENFPLVRTLFERHPHLQVTGPMLIEANDQWSLKYLLSRAPDISIDQTILEAIVSDTRRGKERLQVILDHDKTLPIGPGVVKACYIYSLVPYLKILLQRDPGLEIPEEVFLDVLLKKYPISDDMRRDFAEFLHGVGKKVVFTPEIWKVIDEQFQSLSDQDVKKLYLELEKTDEDA